MNIQHIKKYDIIKEIGRGITGIVYKIKIDNKYYALKISKIITEDLAENGKINREIDFFNKIGSKYPNYFTSYYGNYITTINILNNEKCDIMIDINDLENIELQNYIVKHKNTNIFIYRIYDLIDFPVEDVLYKLSINQIYSMIIQITNIIRLLHKNNYIHGDIHLKNIGVIETLEKYIEIDDIKYETYGYIYKLIDFDSILHKDDDMTDYEKNKYYYLYDCEYINILNGLVKINYGIFDKYQVLKYWCLYETKSNNEYIDENYEYLLRNNKIKQIYDNRYINLYVYYLEQNDTIISKEDIYYIINNRHNYDDVIKYMNNKLKHNNRKNNRKNKLILLIFIILCLILIIHQNKNQK